MDSKNDDSAGSDSLDKSLQKKCVVDDVGQGEGAAPPESPNTSGNKRPDSAPDEQETSFTFHSEQTTKSVGDGGVGDDTTTASSSSERTTLSGDGSNGFETKVKQISKNLKETTLAESESHTALTSDVATDALIAAASSSNSSSSSSSSTSFESETALPSGSSHAESANQSGDQDSSVLSANESMDDQDNRSKKVRFHPDVKENDGGNRVIPKKKKKFKSYEETAAANAQRTGSTDEDMELDEEEDVDDEEEFDLAKTIAEAQDYLKLHPLTFVRPHDKSASLHNGLLEEEDMPQQAESSEDEDYYEQVPPENGIERILGKQVKCGKVEFLLRFADHAGLFWESEDFIWKNCPNLLNSYDHNRERRQERLMRHVAKRQNIRQRYTDF